MPTSAAATARQTVLDHALFVLFMGYSLLFLEGILLAAGRKLYANCLQSRGVTEVGTTSLQAAVTALSDARCVTDFRQVRL
jgi:hypothetical protein